MKPACVLGCGTTENSEEGSLYSLFREGSYLHDSLERVSRNKTLLTKLYLEEFGTFTFCQEELDWLYDVQAHFLYDCGAELLREENIQGPWCLLPIANKGLVYVKPGISVEARLFIIASIETGFDKRIDFPYLKRVLLKDDSTFDQYLGQYTSFNKSMRG